MKDREGSSGPRLRQSYIRALFKGAYLRLRSLLAKSLLRRPEKQGPLDELKVKRILVIKLERIGDLVLATPVLGQLRQRFSQARITLLVNNYTKELLQGNPNIDELLAYQGAGFNLFSAWRFAQELKSRRFDLVIDLTCNENLLLPALFSYLSQAGYRVGLTNFGDKYKALGALMFDIVKPLGVHSNDLKPELYPAQASKSFAKEMLDKLAIKEKDLLIGIHPGAYYPAQRWSETGFAQTADALIQRYRAKVLFLASPKEAGLVFRITNLMKDKPQGIFTALSLQQLMGLMRRLDLLVCNNSGPLHIAVALGVPTVSTMGPTIPQRWWPQGKAHLVVRKDLNCSPCNLGRCKRHNCMNLITTKDILSAVKLLIDRFPSQSGTCPKPNRESVP